MNLSHFSSFLGNFQLSRVDIWKWKILPNGPKNIFLAWRNKLLIFIIINRSKTADELSLWAILLKKSCRNGQWYIFCEISPFALWLFVATNSQSISNPTSSGDEDGSTAPSLTLGKTAMLRTPVREWEVKIRAKTIEKSWFFPIRVYIRVKVPRNFPIRVEFRVQVSQLPEFK